MVNWPARNTFRALMSHGPRTAPACGTGRARRSSSGANRENWITRSLKEGTDDEIEAIPRQGIQEHLGLRPH